MNVKFILIFFTAFVMEIILMCTGLYVEYLHSGPILKKLEFS